MPMGLPSTPLMDFWLERLLKNSSALFKIYFRSGIPAFLQSRSGVGYPDSWAPFVGIVAENSSPCLLLPRSPNVFIDVIMICRSSKCNILDLSFFPFSIFFYLNCGYEVIPIFMSQGTIVLLIILQLILYG